MAAGRPAVSHAEPQNLCGVYVVLALFVGVILGKILARIDPPGP